ncbi:nucleoside monophosphate kinase [Candidatus Kaiserbacteria bacterium]|nr:nucleoside monophosphate kinase [Candidatus Kaiserbacteria bacterium]
MESRIVLFLGKPGSGKGDQTKLLSEATGWPVVSTSAGMREIAANGGAVGHKLKETMDAGILTPYWLAAYVYLKTILGIPENGSIIFDGTTRTPPEAEIVLQSLTWLNKPFTIFHLVVSDEEIKARIALRKEKEARADDHAVDMRLAEYYASTNKAIDVVRQAGLLTEINGERTREEIAADIRAVLGIA